MNNVQREIIEIVKRHSKEEYNDTLTRFSYLGEGANDFVRLTHNPSYNGYDRELLLIRRMFEETSNVMQRAHDIIEFGPGDGIKARLLMNLL